MEDQAQAELELLERIVPEDLSDWPPYAQALYLRVSSIGRQVTDIHNTIEDKGDKLGLRSQVRDIDKRVRFLESLVKWALGVFTTIATAAGIAWLVHK